jgi:hypothetical protein
LLGRLGGGLRALIDVGNPSLVLTGAFLRLLDGAGDRVNLVVDLSDAGSDELLGGAGSGPSNRYHGDWNGDGELPKHDRSS